MRDFVNTIRSKTPILAPDCYALFNLFVVHIFHNTIRGTIYPSKPANMHAQLFEIYFVLFLPHIMTSCMSLLYVRTSPAQAMSYPLFNLTQRLELECGVAPCLI